MSETFRRDSEWSRIDQEFCLVESFEPRATIDANGRVVSASRSDPYAAIRFECSSLPEPAIGYITHRLFMPGLVVMVFPKDAYRLWTDRSFRPEVAGAARAVMPIQEWKPEVMD